MIHRPRRDLNAIVKAQLTEDVGDVGLDGFRFDHQCCGDLAIGFALRDERGHFPLARRQSGDTLFRRST